MIMMAEENDVPDTPRLVEVMHTDPVLSMAVLRRVNSAYYGLPRRIGEVRQAVFLLGFHEVCNLVLAEAMRELGEILNTREQRAIFHRMMQQSLGTAFFAQHLAFHFELPHRLIAYTLGLLHVVGRLVLLYNLPDAYEALWATSRAGTGPLPEEERGLLGCDHQVLTVKACQAWNLPDTVTTVLGGLPDPSALERKEHQALAWTVVVGAAATSRLWTPQPGRETEARWQRGVASLAALVEVTPAMLVALLDAQREPALQYIASMEAS
ncbi:MAG: hypothetical protein KatS3mg043_0015 [Rhodothermaceae bacterium]|nr:MAG: hypothetical protein KatS3mg043_0015 [Rhodothermaceae bacterium]